MASVQARWYEPMTSLISSGSRRADRAVEPTRSQNSIVSCRRSAEDGSAGLRSAASVDSAAAPSVAPQSPQNLAFGRLRLPQDGHGAGSGVPHSMQKRFPSDTSAWQFGHSNAAPNTCERDSLAQKL